MPMTAPLSIRRLTPDDLTLMDALLTTFGEAFDDVDNYSKARPSVAYMASLLRGDCFIALAALKDSAIVGGLAAYELKKFEQERSEIYIYDLAVETAHRARGDCSGFDPRA